MRAPTAQRLVSELGMTKAQARFIRLLAKATDAYGVDQYGRLVFADGEDPLEDLVEEYLPKTEKYVRRMHSSPYGLRTWRVVVALNGMNEVLDLHGVEALGPVSMREGPPYEYLNTGDTYAATLIYRTRDNSLHIGSWGDIAERHPEWESASEDY